MASSDEVKNYTEFIKKPLSTTTSFNDKAKMRWKASPYSTFQNLL